MTVIKYFLIAFIFSTGTFITAAAPGDPDPSFGKVGFVTKGFTGRDRASTVLVQTDGKFIVVGADNFTSAPRITLVRYNSNGTLDTTFDGDGIVQTQFGQANGAVLQPDGKIIVVGTYLENTGVFFAVNRFNQNGSLDTTFAGNGVFTDATIPNGIANAVAIQSDGKIVAVGKGQDAISRFNYFVVRLNTDGTLDTTFSGDGRVLTPVQANQPGGTDEAFDVVIQSDQKIVIGGESRIFTLIRYNPDGSLDTSFDGDGVVRTDFSTNIPESSRLRGLAIDQNGRIVATGLASDSTNTGFAFARYNMDGSLDTTFSGDGKLILPNNLIAYDVLIQPDGKILSTGGIVSLLVIRLNGDGSYDTTFGDGGRSETRIFDSGNAVGNDLAIDPNGNIYCAGFGGNGPSDEDFAVAKLKPNGTPSASIGFFGYITSNPFNELTRPSAATAVAIQSNGKILVGGSRVTSNNETHGLIGRYDSKGRVDTAFGTAFNGFDTVGVPGADAEEVNALAVQPDGKFLAVGTFASPSDAGTFAVRYNADGTLDLSFGGSNNGFATISVLSGGGLGQDIFVLPDGKMLIAGATFGLTSGNFKVAVLRLNANGSRDLSFGSGGTATISFGTGDDIGLAMDVQADGKILVAGTLNFSELGNGDIAIARFNANGSIDNTFGTAGKVTTGVGSFNDAASDIRVQSDGKIVIGGVTCVDIACSRETGLIFRFNSNGTPDSSFDNDGRVFVQTPVAGASTEVTSIAIQSNNKIVAAGGVADPGAQPDALLARFNSNGSADAGFGTNGIVRSDIGNTEQTAAAVVIQPDGRIVSAGSSAIGTRLDVAVWRHLGDETAAPVRTKFDFDGDHKTDISIFRPNVGQWWYLRSSDLGNRAFSFGMASDQLVPADFTGDGKTDIALWRESGGEWFVLRSEDSSFYSFPFGTNGDIPAPGDFDGDGRDDPAVFRPSNNTWFILNSSGGTTIQTFGVAGDKPFPADYDGDGRADIAIFRPSVSEWWIQRSSAGIVVYQFGSSGDKPVPADYTGDGKADVAFFRPGSGEWFVLRSEDVSFFSFPFGTAGDIPVPGDYDGDGRADPAVFRPSNNTWFLLKSTAGFEAITFGLSGDIPVPK